MTTSSCVKKLQFHFHRLFPPGSGCCCIIIACKKEYTAPFSNVMAASAISSTSMLVRFSGQSALSPYRFTAHHITDQVETVNRLINDHTAASFSSFLPVTFIIRRRPPPVQRGKCSCNPSKFPFRNQSFHFLNPFNIAVLKITPNCLLFFFAALIMASASSRE